MLDNMADWRKFSEEAAAVYRPQELDQPCGWPSTSVR